MYIINIFLTSTLLFSVISNRLKLLSCILFMISSLFICLSIKIKIWNLERFEIVATFSVDTFCMNFLLKIRNRDVFEHSSSRKALSLTLLDSWRKSEDISFECRLSKRDYQCQRCRFKGNFVAPLKKLSVSGSCSLWLFLTMILGAAASILSFIH